MPESGGRLVEIAGLTKSYGPVRAVDGLDMVVRPGVVTGFLGPNGAGKTTTFRMLLGLVGPDAGTALIGGHRYADLPHPTTVVGAALEAASFHPGRTARDHLRSYAPFAGVDDWRCDEVLAQVGLTEAAGRRVGGFSSGMRQRLALASALLGDPEVLVLDEPANGLDPEGIVWLRRFLRHLAHERGRTVLVSSHVLAELDEMADDAVYLDHGVTASRESVEASRSTVRDWRVRALDAAALAAALAELGIPTSGDDHLGTLVPVAGEQEAAAVLTRLTAHGVAISAFGPAVGDLEHTFLDLAKGGRS